MVQKEIKLQHRKYFGANKKTQYTQHIINIPDDIIRKLDWPEEDHLVILIGSERNDKKGIILKNKNQ